MSLVRKRKEGLGRYRKRKVSGDKRNVFSRHLYRWIESVERSCSLYNLVVLMFFLGKVAVFLLGPRAERVHSPCPSRVHTIELNG